MVTLTINFILAILAGVVTHYLCKWLDSRDR